MSKSKVIKLVTFLPVACLFTGLNLFYESFGRAHSKSGNFKSLTDVLDGIGGRTESDNFLLRIGSGERPEIIGISEDSSFYFLRGYVHSEISIYGDANGDGTYKFNYMVMAVRKGHEDYQVVRPALQTKPGEAELSVEQEIGR